MEAWPEASRRPHVPSSQRGMVAEGESLGAHNWGRYELCLAAR
jgi:hypothetical protein